jgi:hypothetical protein
MKILTFLHALAMVIVAAGWKIMQVTILGQTCSILRPAGQRRLIHCSLLPLFATINIPSYTAVPYPEGSESQAQDIVKVLTPK